ncbi:MAG: ornithine carbamoyltransferase [Cellulosilyticaceae bacterium]
MFGLKGKSLLTLHDFTQEQIDYILRLAKELKMKKRMGIKGELLQGKNIALIFEKPSTRTRCAFTVAAVDEGAHPEYLGKNDIQLGHKESVEDTARVLGRIFDAIEFRGFSQKTVETLAAYSGVPVYNGLTDLYHPTQVLADLLTIQEHLGGLQGKCLVYIGDGRNNMANSLMIGCAKMGMKLIILAPKVLWPDNAHVEVCKGYAKESGGNIIISDEIEKNIVLADIIYTDVWCSMGEEEAAKERIELLKKYQVNKALVNLVKSEKMIFMHCLPAVKGYEVTEEVFESNASVVFDQAENRMHTIKAIMVATLA